MLMRLLFFILQHDQWAACITGELIFLNLMGNQLDLISSFILMYPRSCIDFSLQLL